MNNATMRKAFLALAAIFIALTIWRVGDYVSAVMKVPPIIAYAYSIAVAGLIYTSAYWSRVNLTANGDETHRAAQVRKTATVILAASVVFDTVFNTFESFRVAQPVTIIEIVSVLLYGISPTLAAAAGGLATAYIDRLPTPPKPAATRRKALISKAYDGLLAKIFGGLARIADHENEPIEPDSPGPGTIAPATEPTKPYRCKCGATFESLKARSGHIGGKGGASKGHEVA